VGLTEASPDPGAASEQENAPDGGALPPRPVLGSPPGRIDPTDPFAVAGRKAMWPHVRRMLEREDALRDPTQTEALKRYRVATRRLRAALRVFRDAYPRRTSKRIRGRLRSLAEALGRVRDLDVRVDELDAWARDRGSDTVAAVAPLRAAFEADRRAAASTLVRKVEARGHPNLLSELVAFVEGATVAPGPDDGDTPTRLTRDRAASAIWERYEAVRAFGPVVDAADLSTLHALRIEAKRARYALEYFGETSGADWARRAKRLARLQDFLGEHQDTVMLLRRLQKYAETVPARDRELTLSVGSAMGHLERAGRMRRSDLRRAWSDAREE